jgi:hypothetical protein
MRWAGHVSCIGELRNVHTILVRKREGRRPFGRSRRRWEDYMEMALKEMGYEDVDWIHMAQNRVQ